MLVEMCFAITKLPATATWLSNFRVAFCFNWRAWADVSSSLYLARNSSSNQWYKSRFVGDRCPAPNAFPYRPLRPFHPKIESCGLQSIKQGWKRMINIRMDFSWRVCSTNKEAGVRRTHSNHTRPEKREACPSLWNETRKKGNGNNRKPVFES